MSKPDFEKVASKVWDDADEEADMCGNPLVPIETALRSAYAAGLERAAEIVGGSRCGGQSAYDLGWDQGADKIGDSIRAEKETVKDALADPVVRRIVEGG